MQGAVPVLVVCMTGGIPACCTQQAEQEVQQWTRQIRSFCQASNDSDHDSDHNSAVRTHVLVVRVQPGGWPCAWVAAAGTVSTRTRNKAQASKLQYLTCWHAEDSDAWAKVVSTVKGCYSGNLIVLDEQRFPRWSRLEAVLAHCKRVAVPSCLGWQRAGLITC